MLYDNDKIRTLMAGKSLSGNALAKLAGISGPSMHAILKGQTKHIKYETMARIATALGVPIGTILKARTGKQKRDLQSDAATAFAQLSPENQAAMLATMLHLASQQKK
jgi:DNA-binding Xre family transcriptional regulator